MTVYNGDVNVNPDLLKLGIKRMEELTSTCVNLTRSLSSLKTEIVTLQEENRELRSVISGLCGNIKMDALSNELSNFPEKDFRTVESVFRDKLSIRAYNCFVHARIKVLADFDFLSLRDLKNIRNLGNRSQEEVIPVLKSEGIELLEESKEKYDTDISAGTHLLMLCDYDEIKKGDVVVVDDFYKVKFVVKPFRLTQYPCKKLGSNKTVYLTPSMVKKI